HPTALLISALMTFMGCGGGTIGEDYRSASGNHHDAIIDPEGKTLSGLESGLRRLSRLEYERALWDLLGLQLSDVQQRLPEDAADPFNNNYEHQLVSSALVDGLESLA